MAVEAPTMEKLYSIREVAEMLSVHPNTVREWVEKGAIKAIRVGPTKLIRIAESVLREHQEPYPAEKNLG